MQIWKMKSDRSGATRLTNDQTHEMEWARPSPDGTKIVFTKANKGESVNFAVQSNTLWVMDIDGSNQREIISKTKRNGYGWTGFAHPEWSPDSTKIVLVSTLPDFTAQLFVIDANGNNKEQITETTSIDGQPANVLDPSWSKNNQIVYVRQWNCFFICSNHDVFKMDYNTRQETRITNDADRNFDPYISPDGKTYLWLSFRSGGVTCPCDLIRGSTTGALNPQAVIADGGSNSNGTFSGDSSKILFLKQVGNKQVLHRINANGSGLTSISVTAVGEGGPGSYVPQVASSGGGSTGGGPTGTGGSTGGGGSTNTGGSTSGSAGTQPKSGATSNSGSSTSSGSKKSGKSSKTSSKPKKGATSNSPSGSTSSGAPSGSQAGGLDNSISSDGSTEPGSLDDSSDTEQSVVKKAEVFANKIARPKTAIILIVAGTTATGLGVGGFFLYRKFKKPKIRF